MISIFSCVILVTLLGCTRTQKFRVIDAGTGEPIGGVHVTRFSNGTEVIAPARRQNTTLPDTGLDGITTARGLDASQMDHSFRFSRAGYSGALAELFLPEAEVSVVSPDTVAGKAMMFHASAIITIPLHRVVSDAPASTRHAEVGP